VPDEKLARYRAMRDFTSTAEPSGEPSGDEHASAADGRPRFVIQEHHATALHWDLRLERDGVLVSWAVPKGLPPDPKRNHLAIQTEDHPMGYIDFAGEIPEGSYGAGRVSVWDSGTYDLHEWKDGKVQVTFHGRRARGRYALFRTRGKQWMIHRMDPPDDPDWQPPPEGLRPMHPVVGSLPDDDGWAFEIAWPGQRMLIAVEGGRATVTSDAGDDVTARWPEARAMAETMDTTQVVLDAIAIVPGDDGRPDAARLQRRLEATESALRRQSRDAPATIVLIDALWLDGHLLVQQPYRERRHALLGLGLQGPNWQTPAHHEGDGAALLDAAAAQGLPGLVAKRLDSPYRPGERSGDWIYVPSSTSK
jgi:bifunctional non-homologous end joining protein LigD